MSSLQRAFALLLVAVVTPGPACLLHAQTTQGAADLSEQQMEDTVRNTYGALSFICSLGAVVRHAEHQYIGAEDVSRPRPGRHDMHEATPMFTITNMSTGTITSIGQRKFKEFFDVPSGPILRVDLTRQYHEENNTHAEWRQCEADWDDFKPPYEVTDDNSALGMSMQKVADLGSTEFTTPATYTQYAAFNIVTTLGDVTIGPHKAIFFFGHDKQGKLVVAPDDIADGDQALWTVLKEQIYPTQLLTSALRDTPAVMTWAKSNTFNDANCSTVRSDLCCHDGRCGLPQSKAGRDLALPLTAGR